MCNLINIHTHRMTKITGLDFAVMCNLINTHTHTPLGGSLRMAWNDCDDSAGLRGYVRFNKYAYTHTTGTFIPHARSSLQTGSGACGHPTAPFARPGVCTCPLYRGGNWVLGMGRGKRGRDQSRGQERRRKRNRGRGEGRKRWWGRERSGNANGTGGE